MGVVSASTQLHNLPQVQIEISPNFKLGIIYNHMPFCGFEEALYLRMRMLLPYSLYDLAHSYRLRPRCGQMDFRSAGDIDIVVKETLGGASEQTELKTLERGSLF